MSNVRGGIGNRLAAARGAVARALGHSMLPSSLRRWRIGHQLFIVHDQMLLTSVVVQDRALAGRDSARAERGFDRLAQLFLASTAALRHTGDFPSGVYEWVVAPDMVSFYPTPGMSGGNMLDHRLLVKAMRSLVDRHGETIRLAPIAVYDAYLRFEHARAAALDSHRHVCVWSAGNRKSLASNKRDVPAGAKIDELDRRRRRDLTIGPRNDGGEPSRAEHINRPLQVEITGSPTGCPITRLHGLILRWLEARRPPHGA